MPNRACDSNRLSVVYRFAVLCGLTAFAAAAQADELPEPLTTASSDATLITSEPIDGDALPLDPEPYVNDEPWYTVPARRIPPYFARFRGGASYFDVPDESKMGGEYGADVVVPLIGRHTGYGNISINHYSGGTQVLGQVGLLQAGVPCAADWTDRLGWLVVFDQFTDTRFDDLYLSSLQAGVTYTVDAHTLIGAVYTEPLEDDNIDLVVIPGATISGEVSQSRAVRAYVSRRFDSTLLSGWVGYRDVADTTFYGGSIRHAISANVGSVVQATYQDAGIWSAFAGIEIAFGPSSGARCCADHCASLDSGANGDIVRGGPKSPRYYIEDGQIVEFITKEKKDDKNAPSSVFADRFLAELILGGFTSSASDYGSQTNGPGMGGMGGMDCEALVTQLLNQFGGSVETVRAVLAAMGRTDCLNDPRLNPEPPGGD